MRIYWGRGASEVEPADHAPSARWTGAPAFLGFDLVQAMRRLLVSDEVDPRWSKRAPGVIASMRRDRGFLRDAPAPLVEGDDGITWWTYADGRANLLLAKVIEAELGGRCVVRNTSITCKEAAALGTAALRDLIHRLAVLLDEFLAEGVDHVGARAVVEASSAL